MGELNDARQRVTGVNPNVAEQIRGFYLESSYFIVPRPAPKEVAVFLRYENFDTQYKMPRGFVPLEEFDRDAWIVGCPPTFPIRTSRSRWTTPCCTTRADVIQAPNAFNIGLGWWF